MTISYRDEAGRFLFDDVLAAMARLEKSFLQKVQSFDHIVKSGRTHLMDTLPIRLGQEFAAYERRCNGARLC